jgi:ferredoxin-thioredoxin reductase catalytic chain
LFLTPDNEFAGEKQDISLETIKEVRDSMGWAKSSPKSFGKV